MLWQSLTLSTGTLSPLIFISFYTWFPCVLKQPAQSGENRFLAALNNILGFSSKNVQDKLKVTIHFRAVSHSAWSEIVPAVLTAFALAWSRNSS